jgi:hypothetical protein
VTINSTLFKELIYQKASDLFHQWTDTRNSYGLNFASRQEADSFAATVTECINKLKGIQSRKRKRKRKDKERETKRLCRDKKLTFA